MICVHAYGHGYVQLCDPVDYSSQVPPSMGFPSHEYYSWSGLPFPTPGALPDSEIEPNVSYISCIGRQILYHCITWEAYVMV